MEKERGWGMGGGGGGGGGGGSEASRQDWTELYGCISKIGLK